MVFVPGALFSVSEATTQLVPGLFARNERVICHFETALGPMAVILVGAIFVGSMETVWHGEVHGQRGQPTKWVYQGAQRRRFAAGDEIGRFNMGSTVIVLLPHGAGSWESGIVPGGTVRLGQAIGRPAGTA
jgi:phosphatidylserine decarboxylase